MENGMLLQNERKVDYKKLIPYKVYELKSAEKKFTIPVGPSLIFLGSSEDTLYFRIYEFSTTNPLQYTYKDADMTVHVINICSKWTFQGVMKSTIFKKEEPHEFAICDTLSGKCVEDFMGCEYTFKDISDVFADYEDIYLVPVEDGARCCKFPVKNITNDKTHMFLPNGSTITLEDVKLGKVSVFKNVIMVQGVVV